MNHKIKVTVTYKYYDVIHSVRLNKNLKYETILFDMTGENKQNHWTMKIGHSDLQKY